MTAQQVIDQICKDYSVLNIRVKRIESSIALVCGLSLLASVFAMLAFIRSLH
jgi:hypothetical protein